MNEIFRDKIHHFLRINPPDLLLDDSAGRIARQHSGGRIRNFPPVDIIPPWLSMLISPGDEQQVRWYRSSETWSHPMDMINQSTSQEGIDSTKLIRKGDNISLVFSAQILLNHTIMKFNETRAARLKDRTYHLKRNITTITNYGTKLNQKQVRPCFPHDIRVKVTLVARPLLTPVTLKLCSCEYGVLTSRTCVPSRKLLLTWLNLIVCCCSWRI
jgi:hypothetical protein